MSRISRESRIRASLILIVSCVLATATLSGVAGAAPDPADPSPVVGTVGDTLAWVNHVPILSTQLDQLLRETHSTMSPEGMKNFDPRRLLAKAINDELLVQQAEALDLADEPEIRAKLEETKRNEANSLWIHEHYRQPTEVDSNEIRRSYRINYERIQLRQISLRTQAEAQKVRDSVLAGASMDSLARALSLDTKKLEGGLYRELPLMEVPAVMLRAARNLKQGEVSRVFPNKDAWTFVKMERRSDAPEAGLKEATPTLTKLLLRHHRKLAWRSFVDSLKSTVHVEQDARVIAAIRADSTRRFTADFMKGTNDPALLISGAESVSDYELRQEVSHQTMDDGSIPFERALQSSIDRETESLLLDHLADRDGYSERPEVLEAWRRARRQTLIQSYLNEAVVSRITFSHAEFKEYYEANREKWRGPEEVQLDLVVIPDEEQAKDLARRLEAGADFQRIIPDYKVASESKANERSWASIATFSEQMQSELKKMEIGDVSHPLKISQGWLFFRLDGRRAGKIPSIEEMDSTIRGVMFQRKFKELLDEHLKLLKSRSTIERNESAIAAYFTPDS